MATATVPAPMRAAPLASASARRAAAQQRPRPACRAPAPRAATTEAEGPTVLQADFGAAMVDEVDAQPCDGEPITLHARVNVNGDAGAALPESCSVVVDGAETACESVGQGTFAAQVGVEAGASPRVVVFKGGDDEALVDCVLDLPSKRVGRADFGSVEVASASVTLWAFLMPAEMMSPPPAEDYLSDTGAGQEPVCDESGCALPDTRVIRPKKAPPSQATPEAAVLAAGAAGVVCDDSGCNIEVADGGALEAQSEDEADEADEVAGGEALSGMAAVEAALARANNAANDAKAKVDALD